MVHLCVIFSGVNDLRLIHDHKVISNGDIDKLKLETLPYHRRRNWWINTQTAFQKDVLVNADGRYECPRDYCRKTYKEASSLQRHIRCVFLKKNLNYMPAIPILSSYYPKYAQLPMIRSQFQSSSAIQSQLCVYVCKCLFRFRKN